MDSSIKKKIKYVLFLAVLIMLGAAAVIFVKKFKLENIQIYGSERYSADVLKAKFVTEKTDDYAILLYWRLKSGEAVKIPFIEKYDAELTDRNTVTIRVYDKAVIGCVKQMEKYMHFDREGYVVECTDERPYDIPEVKGLNFSNIVMNEKLDTKGSKSIDTVLEIVMLLHKNGLFPEDISFSDRYEVTLHMNGDDFLLGQQDNYDRQINSINSVLQAGQQGNYVYDFRRFDAENGRVTAKKKDNKE